MDLRIISFLPNEELFKVKRELLESEDVWCGRLVSDPILLLEFYRYIEGVVLLGEKINLYPFHNLKYLDLAFVYDIKDDDIRFLIQLRSLKLGTNNNITNLGLMYMKKLKVLDLGENQKINNVVFQYIPQINTLRLGHNQNITKEGINKLSLISFDEGYNKNFN